MYCWKSPHNEISHRRFSRGGGARSAAYPPDLSFLFARAFASPVSHSKRDDSPQRPPASSISRQHANTVAREAAQTVPAPLDASPVLATPVERAPMSSDTATANADNPAHGAAPVQHPFQRGLGAYPLRSRWPAALILRRPTRKLSGVETPAVPLPCHTRPPTLGRASKPRPKTAPVGVVPSDGAQIDNHHSAGSWTYVDRSDVPAGRSLVRLIWVYKRKRSGALKAHLCVQGCAQVHGVDYDQRFCATLRPTSLRTLALLAAKCGLSMCRRDFVAAYLQG
eukprot:844624-Pleurochrysis_carterae.AAC.1